MFTRFYYTLNELQNAEAATINFKSLFNYWDIDFTEGSNTGALYQDIELTYGNKFIAYVDIYHCRWEYVEKPTIEEIKADEDLNADIVGQLKLIKAWLLESQFRYDTLIDIYNDAADKLMDDIKSTTQFNDTPITTETGLDGDNYATTYTTNKTAGGTNMQRLVEIRSYWQSLFSEWVGSFGTRFVIYNF